MLRLKDWLLAIERLEWSTPGLALTIQGGEPTLHPDFYPLMRGLSQKAPLHLLTNIQFDVDLFSRELGPEIFDPEKPYAAIRVSYHPETMDPKQTLSKVKTLSDRGYSVGLFSVKDPRYTEHLHDFEKQAHDLGLDFRFKELLGLVDGQLHGTFRYQDAVSAKVLKSCECRTTELLISPSGEVHRCHHDLYNRINSLGDLTHLDTNLSDRFLPCAYFGNCNPCDVKIKHNRFQEYGHTSVEIINIRPREVPKTEAYLWQESSW